jgi:hypothetical protein
MALAHRQRAAPIGIRVTILTVNAGSHSLHLANVDRDVISARLDRFDPPDSVGVADAVDEFLASHEPPEAER